MRFSIDSLASNPQEAPIYYHWYLQDHNQPGPISRFRSLLHPLGLDEYLMAHIIGEFCSLLRRLQKGVLKAEDEIKPVRISKNEPMYELRALYELPGDDQFILRVYNAEPAGLGSTVIGLHLHRKIIYSNDGETNSMQDAEIDKAVRLYHRGKPENWGLPSRS
jgi:hypothetical protein